MTAAFGNTAIRHSLVCVSSLLFILISFSSASTDSSGGDAESVELTASDFENMTVVWDNNEMHNSDVWMVRFSPDGSKLVSVGFDGQIVIWDAETSEALANSFGHHTTNIRCVAWSPDGAQLATGDEKGIIKVWNATLDGDEPHELLKDAELTPLNAAHIGPVVALSWSQDGNTLVSVSGEDSNLSESEFGDNVVKLWDVDNVSKLTNLTQFSFQAMDAAFHPAEPEVLGVAGDNELRIYNITSGEELHKFVTNGTAHCIAWSPDGKLLVTGTRNFDVELYDLEKGELKTAFYDPEFKRREIAWSPSGKFMAEAGSGENVKIRAVDDGSIVKVLYGPSSNFETSTRSSRCSGYYLPSVAWSPSGRFIATASAGVSTVTVFADKKYDRIRPEIVSSSPTGTNVLRGAAIAIRFSEPISEDEFRNAFSYTNSTETWTASDGILIVFGREFIFYPDEQFPANSAIFVTIESTMEDPAGNTIAGTNFWTFKTARNSAPILSNSYIEPSGGDTDTAFSFTVHFIDYDGDIPQEIAVVIDSTEYAMSWKNGSAFDGNYFFRTKLVEGEHSFYFTATDGMADAVGTPTKQDGFVLDVEKTDDIGGINPLTADVVGGIIVLALILGWFKIVMRNNKEKKE